jgi:hypothetical protein
VRFGFPCGSSSEGWRGEVSGVGGADGAVEGGSVEEGEYAGLEVMA